ncbi:probable phosphoglycerate mutase [Dethiosulfatibacter aminovorans DSM 17477]|uniref:Probable phosphoglycerate mutase n=1 Tax=Dethiosulfatibacter aminovorans DSM 17477 TaxID=1121476 RepID=A0A1M6K3B4_9FIRM|nr:histidine phosphatase family protein [Dethiosulfatibacter aminovorans]SHJ53428.1 probable phosphoglycerate mutase [Dethiosulfatibacter aminovorans DSM 17477]
MKVYITRHGETEWNIQGKIQGFLDSPLTEQGLWGADRLSEAIKAKKIDYIIASPLMRAFRTAKIAAGDSNIPVLTSDSLKEINCGDFQGYGFKEVWEVYPELKDIIKMDPYNFKYPGGESLKEFNERVIGGFESILEEYKDSNILLVGHGGTIKCITNYIFKEGDSKSWFVNVVDNCSLTEFDYDSGEFTLVDFNNTEHMKDGKIV